MQASVYTCTRVGGMHDRNEDRVLVGSSVIAATRGVEHVDVEGPTVLGVFDGLGGHAAGDVASELAARTVADAEPPHDEVAVSALLQHADDVLLDAMRTDPQRVGMGTTAALLVLCDRPDEALVANVGDSTVWRLGDGQAEEVSVSDRWQASGVLQCLGANDDGVTPHVRTIAVAPGDRLLIATDGLTDVVPAEVLRTTLHGDPATGSDRLLALVERAGFPDDLTFVVADVIR